MGNPHLRGPLALPAILSHHTYISAIQWTKRPCVGLGLSSHWCCRVSPYIFPLSKLGKCTTRLSYAATINVVRCRLSFALLRSAITALSGSRRRAPTSTSFQPALALAEARVPHWPLTFFFLFLLLWSSQCQQMSLSGYVDCNVVTY